MGTVPAAIITLLASKQQKNPDGFSWELYIESQPGTDRDPLEPTLTEIIQGYSSATNNRISNHVATADGRFVCGWIDATSKKLILGFTPDERYFTQNYPCTSTVTIDAITVLKVDSCQVKFWRDDDTGDILVFVNDPGGNGNASALKCYKSDSGNCDDLALLSTVASFAARATNSIHGLVNVPVLAANGDLILSFCSHGYYDATIVLNGMMISTSADKGATWTERYHNESTFAATGSIGQPMVIAAGTAYCVQQRSGGAEQSLLRSINNGAAWNVQVSGWDVDFGTGAYDNCFPGPMYYDARTTTAYLIVSALPGAAGIFSLTNPTAARVEDKTLWVREIVISDDAALDNRGSIWEAPSQKLAMEYTISGAMTVILGYTGPIGVDLPVKYISVNRNKGMPCASATVVIDNTSGAYTPDKTGDWLEVIWPNHEITIDMGYGATRRQVFDGYIDSVRESVFPAEITITARDKLKKVLDKYVTDSDGGATDGAHAGSFASMTVEAIFAKLADWASFAPGDIVTETTGVTLVEFKVSWETYADAMTRLADLVGFEWYVGCNGKLYFHYATDRTPSVTDEALVLNGVAWTNLAHNYVVSTSDKAYSTAGKDPHVDTPTYSNLTDYEIELGNPARVRRRAGTTIPDGGTIYLHYVYAQARLTEGADIFRLSYEITDRDLAYDVVAHGKTTADVVLEATTAYSARAYYHVMEDKLLVIDAPWADTALKLQAVSDRAAYRMRAAARTCEFFAIANPWLDIGECIQVVETTTTISEIYRIKEFDLIMEPSQGFFMRLGTHYYGYSPL